MTPSFDQSLLQNLLQTQPETITLGANPVTVTDPVTVGHFPVCIQPAIEYVAVADWIRQNKEIVAQKRKQYGAILFRGFALDSAETFEKAFAEVTQQPLLYTNRTSPRTLVNAHVYTSTDHPADQYILMHTESSYAPSWPLTIGFFCLTPSITGGETPIADVRKVYQLLRPETIAKFEEKQVMYVRNMRKGIGLSWQQVYQTDSRAEVEAKLTQDQMSFEWVSDDHLRVRWVRPAVRKHPVTDEWIWFNHAYFYHKKSLDANLVACVAEEDLPFTTYYGDGSRIADDVVDEITAAYQKCLLVFPWQKGDFLLLDNMLMAHGRNPFSGERKILVAMGDAMS